MCRVFPCIVKCTKPDLYKLVELKVSTQDLGSWFLLVIVKVAFCGCWMTWMVKFKKDKLSYHS